MQDGSLSWAQFREGRLRRVSIEVCMQQATCLSEKAMAAVIVARGHLPRSPATCIVPMNTLVLLMVQLTSCSCA